MRSVRLGHGGRKRSLAGFLASLENAASPAMDACGPTGVLDGSNHLERKKHDALSAAQVVPRQLGLGWQALLWSLKDHHVGHVLVHSHCRCRSTDRNFHVWVVKRFCQLDGKMAFLEATRLDL